VYDFPDAASPARAAPAPLCSRSTPALHEILAQDFPGCTGGINYDLPIFFALSPVSGFVLANSELKSDNPQFPRHSNARPATRNRFSIGRLSVWSAVLPCPLARPPVGFRRRRQDAQFRRGVQLQQFAQRHSLDTASAGNVDTGKAPRFPATRSSESHAEHSTRLRYMSTVFTPRAPDSNVSANLVPHPRFARVGLGVLFLFLPPRTSFETSTL